MALLDLRMPGLSGIEVARKIAQSAPETAVILYTAFGDRALLTEALDAGARGFVLKEAPSPRSSAQSSSSPPDAPTSTRCSRVCSRAQLRPSRWRLLTQRERDVLRLLADGHSNEEIGKELFISAETVRTHVRKAMAKLDADTRTQAVATALRQSLIA